MGMGPSQKHGQWQHRASSNSVFICTLRFLSTGAQLRLIYMPSSATSIEGGCGPSGSATGLSLYLRLDTMLYPLPTFPAPHLVKYTHEPGLEHSSLQLALLPALRACVRVRHGSQKA